VPRTRGPNTTLSASVGSEGMGPCLAVIGLTTAAQRSRLMSRRSSPRTYLLRPRQIVVMDNLSAHKGPRVRELVQERSCELLYLPPYLPDLEPVVRRLLPRSRARCAKPRLASARPWSKRWARRSQRSGLVTPAASSSTGSTARRFNRYDEPCNHNFWYSVYIFCAKLY
jgi:transposase